MVLRNVDMFVWTSDFHNPLAHTHFNMFVDKWTSADKSPDMSVAPPQVSLGLSMGIYGPPQFSLWVSANSCTGLHGTPSQVFVVPSNILIG